MTDKVIIDGVEVQDCEWFSPNYKEDDLNISNYCELYHEECQGGNCDYKLLQRKTQEHEKLNEQLDTAKTAYEMCLMNKENRHKQETQKLKSALEEIETFGNTIKEYLGSFYNKIKKPEQQYGRWKPTKGKIYYYNTDDGRTFTVYWCDSYADNFRYSIGNCYKTIEQAQQTLERLKIRTQLEDIALRLNKGQKITFGIDEEYKYYLQFAFDYSEINQCETRYLKSQDVIYCLDNNFKDVAISEIGEERLAKYLKEE